MNKPREFWIKAKLADDGFTDWIVRGPGIWLANTSAAETFTHVIEYKAYAEALEHVEELKTDIESRKQAYDKLDEINIVLNEQARELKAENAKLREALQFYAKQDGDKKLTFPFGSVKE